MAYKNDGYFFPPEVKPPEGDLRPLSAVKKKKFPFAAEKHGRKMTVRQGHHPPAAKDKSFKIHGRPV
jgi:hypothetical protein